MLDREPRDGGRILCTGSLQVNRSLAGDPWCRSIIGPEAAVARSIRVAGRPSDDHQDRARRLRAGARRAARVGSPRVQPQHQVGRLRSGPGQSAPPGGGASQRLEMTLHVPNRRYMNDIEVVQAMAQMPGKVRRRLRRRRPRELAPLEVGVVDQQERGARGAGQRACRACPRRGLWGCMPRAWAAVSRVSVAGSGPHAPFGFGYGPLGCDVANAVRGSFPTGPLSANPA